jgi:hypothetical protein
VPLPKACGHCRCRSGHRRQDIARQQSQLWQALTARTTKHKRPVRAAHLLGRQGALLDRPAVALQAPQRRGCHWPGRHHDQRLLAARGVDHHTPQRCGSRRGSGADEGVPDVGASDPPGPVPRGSGIRGRTRAPELGRRPCGSGPDGTPGRKGAGHPRHTARPSLRQEVGHAAPGSAPQDCSGLQVGSGLPEGPPLQRRCTAVARVRPQHATPQWQAHCTDRPTRRNYGHDAGRPGFVGPDG